MGGSGNKPRHLALEAFDPAPAVRVGRDILEGAGVPYALAGRLAVWAWVPADEQEFTKDVDFAVPQEHMPAVEEALAKRGMRAVPLPIGGVAVRDGDVRLDFIDRRVDFGELYTEAVAAAHESGSTASTPDGLEVPVVPAEYVAAMKIATGDPRDERDVERLAVQPHFDYQACRRIVRHHVGPGSANRLDHVCSRVGLEAAARYVRESNGGGADGT